ncbi:hypothetical protein QQS21_008250 [Conoideocrella luteorostrata]|uniref:NACHT domain-containing protein n=1 Tax=Conoideocrella luteorostrata TaxID=1105319 RepID=A0AAJ0CJ71_9HYPO|nr:hypothetical protein QQS21_008250 [Conoideocrella luteorostrata]
MPDPHDYTVGWICAIATEYVAAQTFLDEKHEAPDHVATHDNNDYALGRIGKHNVVIAVLPHGEYGLTSATSVGRDMLHSFPNVRIGLMVGIAGGAPSPKHDIRLGDVVVSASGGGKGGVLQYDFGESIQGKKFQQKGFLNQPPAILRAAVNGLMAQYESDGHELAQAIDKAIERKPRLRKKYRRPDANTDRLYLPNVLHPQDNDAVCADSCPDDPSQLQSRPSRTEDDDDPAVHYGLVASANQLMMDATIRDALAAEKDVLCFEMESAGLVNHFPCLVIRGICDYSDSHKNKEWQGYAAMTASAYAKDLLCRIAPNRVEAEKKISEVLSGDLKELNQTIERSLHQREDHHREQIALVLTKEQQECHQAFKTSTYEQHKNINPDRVQGTCRWILENSHYLAWQESDHNDLLWVSADPGCGKSVLAKSLIDIDLKASTSATICYFFFKDNDDQNSFTTALCAILHQLFDQQPHLLRHALPCWQKNGMKIQQEADELWRVLKAAMSDVAFSNTICIFDALDECRLSDRAHLLNKLEHFYTQSYLLTRKNWLKFLVTSRPYDEIQEGFLRAAQLFPYIHVRGEEENNQIHEEINLVIKAQVNKLGESLQLAPETQERLEQQLLQMKHRTYLWLHLAINDIYTVFGNSLQPEQESIRLIPSSVSDAYAKILDRVPSNKASDVRTILRIIVGARRPLTIEEMAMALGLAKSPGSRAAAKCSLNPKGLDTKIRRLCGLFVFINNSRVYLIHQTAREFLLTHEQEWFLQQSETETLLSEICINYLLLDDTHSMSYWSDRDDPSFLRYSAEYWPDHVRAMPSLAESRMETRIDQLYDVTSARFATWYHIFWTAVMQYRFQHKVNAICLAAFNGHKNVLQRLILRNRDMVNQPDETGTNALGWASRRGHVEIVQMLLDNGADVHARDKSSFQAACYRGYVEIVRMLLENGADVNAKDGPFGNALQAASDRGHVKTVQILLDNGADVNAQSKAHGNALQRASNRGHVETVHMLLDNGADVNAQGGYFGNALQAASITGHVETVQILLDNGADVNSQSRRFGNALQAASGRGHIEIVQMLIDNGADVNAQGGPFGNALQAASDRGHADIAQILLEKGATGC